MNLIHPARRWLKEQFVIAYYRWVLYERTPAEVAERERIRREENLAFIRHYLSTASDPRLHLGCGPHLLEGWLNTDLQPPPGKAAAMDASQPFPLPDNTFRLVFSEHMIEHIPYPEGQSMLRECFRVLRPGGRLRIVTPDLAVVLSLYGPEKSPLQRRYLEWSAAELKNGAFPAEAVFVINNFVRDWGHQFIYDAPTLRRSLESAGFNSVVAREVEESDEPSLRGLENVSRLPEGFVAFESLVFEAMKPTS